MSGVSSQTVGYSRPELETLMQSPVQKDTRPRLLSVEFCQAFVLPSVDHASVVISIRSVSQSTTSIPTTFEAFSMLQTRGLAVIDATPAAREPRCWPPLRTNSTSLRLIWCQLWTGRARWYHPSRDLSHQSYHHCGIIGKVVFRSVAL